MTRERCHKRSVFAAATVLLATLTTSGCVWAPELTRVKNDIESQLPHVRFEKEFALSLGPLALGVTRLVTKIGDDTDHASAYLKDVRRVQVAVYNATSVPALRHVRMPERLERKLEEGWETAVRVRKDDSVVWVMYRADEESVRDLYVVVLDESELVIVKASGRLERLVARALREGEGFPGIPHVGDYEDTF